MTPPPQTNPGETPSALQPRSYFNNWMTAIGAVIAVGALFSFGLLVAMDFSEGQKNPYLGILTYIVAPIFLIAGLGAVIIGALIQRRHIRQHLPGVTHRWSVDFADPHQRRFLLTFFAGSGIFIMLSAFGSYQTYHYSESTQFCGEVCHKAMGPELSAYQHGAHARVECVSCHIGSGAKWFVKAKINGTHQLIAYTLDNYSRPIGTPIKNLRPAQDICEKCHWPGKIPRQPRRQLRALSLRQEEHRVLRAPPHAGQHRPPRQPPRRHPLARQPGQPGRVLCGR
ncbi:MAG: NapC/NirT family cytochrome c [Opitutales bacterium]